MAQVCPGGFRSLHVRPSRFAACPGAPELAPRDRSRPQAVRGRGTGGAGDSRPLDQAQPAAPARSRLAVCGIPAAIVAAVTVVGAGLRLVVLHDSLFADE